MAEVNSAASMAVDRMVPATPLRRFLGGDDGWMTLGVEGIGSDGLRRFANDEKG